MSLPAGVGSNPIGLDRGQLGPTHVVVFERVGPKVLLVERNDRYRAITPDAAERRAVTDSFARSVLWGFTAEATDGERVLVDATAFFLRDAHGVAAQLRETRQGRYRVDEARSAIHLGRTKGFPRNTEVEGWTSTTTRRRSPGPSSRRAEARVAWTCDAGSAPDLDALQALDPATDAVAMSLARIRQLSAHEVGHTIGLEHNFAASTYGRASVMDYPAPLVRLREGRIDLSEAYGIGVGAYDRFAITYGYAQFPAGTDEDAALERIVEDGLTAGRLFVADEHARPAGAAHPLGNLWDNGPDPVDGLRHSLEVRRTALAQFGLDNIPVGAPLSSLSVTLVPLYLHHRFQVQAAAKVIGGVYFQYSVKTPAGPRPAPALAYPTPDAQREALATLLGTLDPAELSLRPDLLALLPPRAAGTGGVNTERFPGYTAPAFDPVAAATTAADLTVSALLQPERAARALAAEARDPANLGLADVLDAVVGATWGTPAPPGAERAAIAAAIQSLVVHRVMDLAADPGASPAVRAEASGALRSLQARITAGRAGLGTRRAHRDAAVEEITRFLQRPDAPRQRTPVPAPPPGEPIG